METSSKGRAKRRHLSAAECSGLTQSLTGSQAITQPFTLNLHKNNPNRALQPRTPNKRRQPDGRQQSVITGFFSSAGVLRSSPQKGNTLIIQTEEEQEEVGMDLMEGITEQMFESDEEFEMGSGSVKRKDSEWTGAGCSSWASPPPSSSFIIGHNKKQELEEDDEYDVQSLPDAHYGLLGINRSLLEPQGHIQDLPEELLSVIFAQLPADDLYRHVSLVCRHWRDIVMDIKFLPWKKLYYKYEKQEAMAVKELNALLEDNGIVKKNDLCVLNMVRYMSQFKHTRRMNMADVLRCVKGHRLYPQAEACIKHRLPDMETFDGEPNPWSTMTLMLILADGVKDVQDLVVRLQTSGCLLTPDRISEFLWAMAALLLAMRNTDITITNRWHYNIFYMLHLMENTPPPPSRDGREKQVHVTHEQQQILNHDIQRNHVVKIMAFAGTGKTTTLVRYAQQRPNQRFLYISFNKSVIMQAKHSFPSNVECRTIHSMAYTAIGHKYRSLSKLSNNLKPFTVAWVLPEGRGGFVNAKVVTQTISKFCASTDECIGPQHVPDRFMNTNGREECPSDAKRKMYVFDAHNIWKKMTEMQPTKQAAHHITHDGYLKLWQLQKPELEDYDVIFIDEAQDCTPVIMDIMLAQTCGKILVGDPHQQIYTFRGAVNALHAVPHTHLYYLTQSFRFGPEIAYVGATLLHVCKKVKKILVGGRQDGTVRGEDKERLDSIRVARTQVGGKVAILCRCNLTVFCEVVRLTDINSNCKIHIVGGVENFGLKRIHDIWILMQPEEKRRNENLRIADPFIRSFCNAKLGGYAGLKAYAIHTEDRELEGKLSMVEKFSKRIPELVHRIQSRALSKPDCADYIVGTVHKSKGLEFDTVVVMDDFINVPCCRHTVQRTNISSGIKNALADEWNLLYVAVTRAKRTLYITKSLSNILTLAGEYFLRIELSRTLLNKDEHLKCSIEDCPNVITAASPLCTHKLPIAGMDNTDEGGVLCASCVEQRVGPVAFLLSPPETVQSMHYTREERLDLPINVRMLLALF